MKLSFPNRNRRRNQGGFLVIALFAIIVIMLIYIGANLHVLAALKRDIRLVEQKQVQRLNKSFPPAVTTAAVFAPVAPSPQ